MEPTISRFAIFLGSELLFFIASLAALIVIGQLILRDRALRGRHIVIAELFMTIVSLLFLFLFIWILTGRVHVPLFLIMMISSVGLVLIVEVTWLIVGAPNVPWVGQVAWTQYEFQRLVPVVHKLVQIASALVIVAYPIYIGYGYFGAAFRGPDWPRYVIQTTLILQVGFIWVLQIPQYLYLMMSRNIMEDTRARIFISQLGHSVFILLMISLLLWTIKGEGSTIGVLGDYFVFSPMVAYLATGYVVLLLIIPYLIGHYRAKEWTEWLIGERLDLIDELSKGLVHPNLVKAIGAIEASEAKIQAAIKRISEDPALQLAEQVRDSDDQQLFVFRLALQESEKRDKRILHKTRLETLLSLIADCRQQLSQLSGNEEKRDVLDLYAKAIDKEKGSQQDEKDDSKPWVLVALSTLASSVMSPIWASVAKYVSDQLVPGN